MLSSSHLLSQNPHTVGLADALECAAWFTGADALEMATVIAESEPSPLRGSYIDADDSTNDSSVVV